MIGVAAPNTVRGAQRNILAPITGDGDVVHQRGRGASARTWCISEDVVHQR